MENARYCHHCGKKLDDFVTVCPVCGADLDEKESVLKYYLVKNTKDKLRGKIEVQHYQTAIKSYMRRKDKNLTRLLKYAETLKIRDEIMKYIEVMV